MNQANLPPLTPNLGQILRQERERRGLDLGDIAANTHIRKEYLVALEDGHYEALPENVYTRNFLRLYARALKLEEGPLLDQYSKERYGATLERPPDQNTLYAAASGLNTQHDGQPQQEMAPQYRASTSVSGGGYATREVALTTTGGLAASPAMPVRPTHMSAQATYTPETVPIYKELPSPPNKQVYQGPKEDKNTSNSIFSMMLFLAVLALLGVWVWNTFVFVTDDGRVQIVAPWQSARESFGITPTQPQDQETISTISAEQPAAEPESNDPFGNDQEAIVPLTAETPATPAPTFPQGDVGGVSEVELTQLPIVGGANLGADDVIPLQSGGESILVSVTTDPSGAEVLLDNYFAGITPLDSFAVRPGSKNLTLKLVGYQTHNAEIDLTQNQELTYTLQPEPTVSPLDTFEIGQSPTEAEAALLNTIAIAVEGRAWLEVYAGEDRTGERLLYRIADEGETFEFDLPVFVRAGNSNKVRLVVSGEAVGYLGTDDGIASQAFLERAP